MVLEEQDLAKMVLKEQDWSADIPVWLQKLERCPCTKGAEEFDTGTLWELYRLA